MKQSNDIKKIFVICLILSALCFAVPQVTFASWWNPFSWGIWNNLFRKAESNKTQVSENKVGEKLEEKTIAPSVTVETDKSVKNKANQQSENKTSSPIADKISGKVVAEHQTVKNITKNVSENQAVSLPPINVSCSADLNPNSSTFNTDFPKGLTGYITFKSVVSFPDKTGLEQIQYSWLGGCAVGNSSTCTTLYTHVVETSTTLTVSLPDGRKGTATCSPTVIDVSCSSSPKLVETKNQQVTFTASMQDNDVNSYLYYWKQNYCDGSPSANICVMNNANGGGGASFFNKVILISKDGSKIGGASCLAVVCMPDNLAVGDWWMTRQTQDGGCEFIDCVRNSDCGINTGNITYECKSKTCLKKVK